MIQVLQAISLASSAPDQLAGATGVIGSISAVEWTLTTFAIGSVILSAILLFSVSSGHRRLERHLRQTFADSATANSRLRQETKELTAMNKDLIDTVAGLSGHQKEVLESITDTVSS
jgi:hypothetical protein